ncbi:uncharacterized protein BKCO1_4600055 [Diplodia corticola]|uniref:Uncharacterized protein n=1 Tax=Diplodia corticola TaxID=236234 RepID=A0A1J9RUW5_9PEZI|nr:uncharacterized protein BKCO1_4600055 [Diplodia corticola]OJD31636.1 hypothetical protein BKCO1_4600055 [Diplodia corticola]
MPSDQTLPHFHPDLVANNGNAHGYNHGHPDRNQYPPMVNGSILEAHAAIWVPNGTAVSPGGGHHRDRVSGVGSSRSYPAPDPTMVNPRVPEPIMQYGMPSPPSSAGFPSPEQRRATIPRRPLGAPSAQGAPVMPRSRNPARNDRNFVCCGTQYSSKFTFDRHRRESRTCPYGDGGREFRCFLCGTRPFGRRNTLKQHVHEVHQCSPKDAKKYVDTWYQRNGAENDYPEASVGL